MVCSQATWSPRRTCTRIWREPVDVVDLSLTAEASVAVQDFVSDRPPPKSIRQVCSDWNRFRRCITCSLYIYKLQAQLLWAFLATAIRISRACETPARSIRKRLMFQFPVEMALAIARVSFERSCHDSKMSGYLREFQETSLHNGIDESDISSFPASLRDERSSRYIQIIPNIYSRAWNGHKLWSKRIQKVERKTISKGD